MYAAAIGTSGKTKSGTSDRRVPTSAGRRDRPRYVERHAVTKSASPATFTSVVARSTVRCDESARSARMSPMRFCHVPSARSRRSSSSRASRRRTPASRDPLVPAEPGERPAHDDALRPAPRTARCARGARTRRRTPRRRASRLRDRRPPSLQAPSTSRAPIAIASVRGYAGRGFASSSATKEKSAAAAGYRPQRPAPLEDRSRLSASELEHPHRRRPRCARHGLSARHTFPNRIESSGTPSQKMT